MVSVSEKIISALTPIPKVDLNFGFWDSWGLVSNTINKEAYRNPKKLPGSPKLAIKTFRAEFLTMAL